MHAYDALEHAVRHNPKYAAALPPPAAAVEAQN